MLLSINNMISKKTNPDWSQPTITTNPDFQITENLLLNIR